MTRKEMWDEYLESMEGIADKEFRNSSEYACQQEKWEVLDQWMESLYPEEKKKFFENCAFEQRLDTERKQAYFYRQGMRDCIGILKNLGVLI